MADRKDSLRNRTASESASVRTENSVCRSPSLYEDFEEDVDIDQFIPVPPDGGYGWVIVFCSFMCNLIVDGICYTFGVFLGEFVREFGVGKGVVSWVGSLLAGVYLTFGPVVGAVTNKFGCRATCIFGAIFACIAFILSTFSMNITMLMVTYGIMGGIGFGLIYLPAIVLVGFYFEKKRALATGIAVCGSGAGTFVFAPLASALLEAYDWRGANLILSGIILNCCVFGALMRPLEPEKKKSLMLRLAEEKKRDLERDSLAGSNYFLVQRPDGTYEKRRKAPVSNTDPGVHSNLHLEQIGDKGSTYALHPIEEESNYLTVTSQSQLKDVISTANKNVSEAEGKAANDESPTSAEEVEVKSSADNKPTEGKPANGVPTAMPRNLTQPVVAVQRDSMKKIDSLPIIENKHLAPARSVSRASFTRVRQSSISDNQSEFAGDTISFTAGKPPGLDLSSKDLSRPLARKDVLYTGSIKNLPEFQSQRSLSHYRQSMTSLPRSVRRNDDWDGDDIVEEPKTGCAACSDRFREMFDYTLLKDPVMVLLAISSVFGMLGFYVPFVYIMDLAVSKGAATDQASFLLSLIGITNIIGRLLSGYIADIPAVDSLLVNNVCIALSGAAICLVPLFGNYAGLATLAGLFGFFSSAFIALTSIVLVDLFGINQLTNCFGLICIFRGVAAIVGPPLAGSIYDATGSYDIPFYVAGGFLFVSAIFSFMIPVFNRCCRRENTQEVKSPESENFLQKKLGTTKV